MNERSKVFFRFVLKKGYCNIRDFCEKAGIDQSAISKALRNDGDTGRLRFSLFRNRIIPILAQTDDGEPIAEDREKLARLFDYHY